MRSTRHMIDGFAALREGRGKATAFASHMQVRHGVLVALILLTFVGNSPAVDRGESKVDTSTAETRDVLLMLRNGPLHLRFHVLLNGDTLTSARKAYVDRLIKTLDKDNDGKLTRVEADASPLRQKTSKTSRINATFLKTLQAKQTVSRKEIEKMVERAGGETIRYRQDDSSSENDSQVFKVLDANNDNLLDAKEMMAAADKLRQMDEDRDDCISFRELSPEEPPEMVGLVQVQLPQVERTSARPSDVMRDMRDPRLGGHMLMEYDKNRDRKVDATELNWSAERLAVLDVNDDQMLDRTELTRLRDTPVDLELMVELSPDVDQKTTVRVVACSGKQIDDGERGDMVKIDFGNSVVTFSHRDVDPIPSSIANAMQEFNRLDTDGNGYLEKTETSQRIRFERYLFDQIDTDGDGKIFGEEMEQYITVAAEPRASTCQVNVYDTGRGYFAALDSNNDGRISERELRNADQSLTAMNRDGDDTLALEEPTSHFQVEFVRRMFNLFGSTDQMVAPTVAISERKTTVGPEWFRAWDRNNDGDLTWEEFAGPREIFHRYDADNDQLMDHHEAEKAHNAEG